MRLKEMRTHRDGSPRWDGHKYEPKPKIIRKKKPAHLKFPRRTKARGHWDRLTNQLIKELKHAGLDEQAKTVRAMKRPKLRYKLKVTF